ncbi:hypothetical protein C8Q79DRAFT_1109228 [Trametes meyenii]|nr:hypothetical protein C8Q79DRAFT_1109228 [Trametes meyenii]
MSGGKEEAVLCMLIAPCVHVVSCRAVVLRATSLVSVWNVGEGGGGHKRGACWSCLFDPENTCAATLRFGPLYSARAISCPRREWY